MRRSMCSSWSLFGAMYGPAGAATVVTAKAVKVVTIMNRMVRFGKRAKDQYISLVGDQIQKKKRQAASRYSQEEIARG
ncbi:hypothetical protein KCU62_g107, partial [Aureobasidium sp. EXF-3399]